MAMRASSRRLRALRCLAPLAVAWALTLAGCGSYTTGGATPATGATPGALRDPAGIIVTPNDITDRGYVVLGDIAVTVRKATIFDRDPDRNAVDAALRREAAALGADAVILARYGTLGIDMLSYGRLDGSGRAIRFLP